MNATECIMQLGQAIECVFLSCWPRAKLRMRHHYSMGHSAHAPPLQYGPICACAIITVQDKLHIRHHYNMGQSAHAPSLQYRTNCTYATITIYRGLRQVQRKSHQLVGPRGHSLPACPGPAVRGRVRRVHKRHGQSGLLDPVC